MPISPILEIMVVIVEPAQDAALEIVGGSLVLLPKSVPLRLYRWRALYTIRLFCS